MTPTNLHAAIVARVQARLELARAATPGPWVAKLDDPNDSAELNAPDGHTVAVVAWCDDHPRMARPNFALIAANDPKWTIGMCTAALSRLERHRPQQFSAVGEFAAIEPWCKQDHEPWPCPDVRDEATVWGVEVDGDE